MPGRKVKRMKKGKKVKKAVSEEMKMADKGQDIGKKAKMPKKHKHTKKLKRLKRDKSKNEKKKISTRFNVGKKGKSVKERRATRAVTLNELKAYIRQDKEKQGTEIMVKWWRKESIKYAFCHPYVRSRLEKLMESNLVSVTDREYMQKLQARILEEYAEAMDKRIKQRQEREMVRVKYLVLTGKIPLDKAPESMSDHPVMIIEHYCRRLIAERRAKIKLPKTHTSKHVYIDDTPDPPSGLSIEKGHVFRRATERLCYPIILPEKPMSDLDEEEEAEEVRAGGLQVDEEEEGVDVYVYSQEEYDRMKYEGSDIKELKNCETVDDMYNHADSIIGMLKTLSDRGGDTMSVMSGFSQITQITQATTDGGDPANPTPGES